MKLALIVAAARNGVIGKDNQLPWHLPQDLRYFKRVTLGKPVIMGRKTFESIGRPLPGRTNIVVTRQADWTADNVVVVPSLEAARLAAESLRDEQGHAPEEAMIIGGAEIYRACLPLAARVYLTRIQQDIEGDVSFPTLDDAQWTLLSRESGEAGAPIEHEFLVYERADQ